MGLMFRGGFVRREKGGTAFYSCIALNEIPFLRHGFSTRHGGVSALSADSLNLSLVSWDSAANVAENRRRFLAALGLEHVHVATLSQVHSDRLHILDENVPAENGRPEADALATRQRGIAIAVQVADCFPIIVVDPKNRAVAAVHAGWRGTLARIFTKTVAGMRAAFGSEASDLITAVGPGIHPCSFEVGPEVAEEFRVEYPGAYLSRPHPAQQGKYLLDLPQALRIQFQEAGLRPDSIFDLDACTCCNTNEFFSYRGEGTYSGRMMALVCLE